MPFPHFGQVLSVALRVLPLFPLQNLHRSCATRTGRASDRLENINVLNVVIVEKGNVTERSQGVRELMQEYEHRLARHRQRGLEEDDSEKR